MKVAFYTLGCKVNQVETEQLKEEFLGRGYQLADFYDDADIYIVNTCTVTHISDRKSRAMLRRAARKNPLAIIAAIGCMAQVNTEQLSNITGINLIVGNSQKENIADIIEDYLAAGAGSLSIINDSFTASSNLKDLKYSRRHKRTRSFIKIQDGCENYCSYCLVPYARGPARSKRPEQIIGEIEHMLALGYKELVLTGINTGLYGQDLPASNLTLLIEQIFKLVQGEYRLRLSSIEPLLVNDRLIEIAAEEPRFCRHFHIPLQSGSDEVLKHMNRGYDRNYYQKLLEKIWSKVPGIALTSDIMVGFPAESEYDFKQSLQLLKDLPIYNLHVFQYSARKGTVAAEFKPQVEAAEKQKRSKLLLKLAGQKRREFIDRFRNKELEVLIEEKFAPNLYQGLSDNYIPVRIQAEKDIHGQLIKVVLGANSQGIYDAAASD